MSKTVDFKFVAYEEFYGNAYEIEKQMKECEICTNKLTFHHTPDYTNLSIQEEAHCLQCGSKKVTTLHHLN